MANIVSRPIRSEEPGLRLMLVEQGAKFPESLALVPEDELTTDVLFQSPGEPPSAFIHRVTARVVAIEKARQRIDCAMIMVSGRGSRMQNARTRAARALTLHMARSGGGKVELHAPENGALGLRHELLALAEALVQQGSDVSVRLCFDKSTRRQVAESGVYPVERQDVTPHRNGGAAGA